MTSPLSHSRASSRHDRDVEYEVPDGNRLHFGPQGHGAVKYYDLPSSFEKAAQRKRNGKIMGQAARFPGAKSKMADTFDSPGPGAYETRRPWSASNSQTSRHGSWGPVPKQSRPDLLHHGGEEDFFFAASSLEQAGQEAKRARGNSESLYVNAAATSRLLEALKDEFGEEGLNFRYVEPRKPSKRPSTAGSRGRLDFGPRGEGVDGLFNHGSTFDRAGSKGHTPSSSFGTARRFQHRLNLLGDPGPGSYDIRKSWLKPGLKETPRPNKKEDRLDVRQLAPSTETTYDFKSDFDKAAEKRNLPSSSFGTANRFKSKSSVSDNMGPGPGFYQYTLDTIRRKAPSSSFASPKMRPPGWNPRTRIPQKRDVDLSILK